MRARIGFLNRKMALDLTSANDLDALIPAWHEVFWTLISGLRPEYFFSDWQYDLQGYNFCFETFCAENKKNLETV